MRDLIDRNMAIDAVRKEYAGIHNANIDGDFLADEIEFIITKLPNAQPERKKGLWLFEKSSGKHFCSHCGEYANVDIHNEEILCVYCPICGTRMEGAEDV